MKQLSKYLIFNILDYLEIYFFKNFITFVLINKKFYNNLINYRLTKLVFTTDSSYSNKNIHKWLISNNMFNNLKCLIINNVSDINVTLIHNIIYKYKLDDMFLYNCYGIAIPDLLNMHNHVNIKIDNYIPRSPYSKCFKHNTINLVVSNSNITFLKTLSVFYNKSDIVIYNILINTFDHIDPVINDQYKFITDYIYDIYTEKYLIEKCNNIIHIQKLTYQHFKYMHKKILVIFLKDYKDYIINNMELYISRCSHYNITLYVSLYNNINTTIKTHLFNYIFIDNLNYNQFIHKYLMKFYYDTHTPNVSYNIVKIALHHSRMIVFNMDLKGCFPSLIYLDT
jgi:hypothetical protein